jgi:hypothetical protein
MRGGLVSHYQQDLLLVFSGMNQRITLVHTKEDNNMKHYSGSYQRRQQYETLLWFLPEKTTI